jgi:hypothetical protein
MKLKNERWKIGNLTVILPQQGRNKQNILIKILKIFVASSSVVLNLFLGGDTHFENEKFATHIEYPNYNQMPKSHTKSSKLRFGMNWRHTRRNSRHTNVPRHHG